MKYKPSIFNISGVVCLMVTLVYTIFHWHVLSKGEGWGVFMMFGAVAICVIVLLIDLILQFFIKNNWLLNSIELIILLVAFTLTKP